jgi:hypothetical protein
MNFIYFEHLDFNVPFTKIGQFWILSRWMKKTQLFDSDIYGQGHSNLILICNILLCPNT